MRYTGCFLLLLAGTLGLHAASDPRLKDAVKRGSGGRSDSAARRGGRQRGGSRWLDAAALGRACGEPRDHESPPYRWC